MYQFVLLRHGRSLADDENRCEGRYDSPLTSVGEEQAGRTAQTLKDKGSAFDRILSSPLRRARRTAEIIAEVLQVEIEFEPLLMEHDNGIIAGMPKSQLNEMYPLPEFDSPFRYFPEHTGENAVLEHARAGLALNSLIDRGPGRYLIVTHGGIGNAIMRNILGINYVVNGSGVSFRLGDNGRIEFTYDEGKHHWRLLRME